MHYERTVNMFCSNCGKRLYGIFVNANTANLHCDRCKTTYNSTKISEHEVILRIFHNWEDDFYN